jgi:hypothetical protein
MLDLVFLLLIPAMAQGEHLAALAARHLRDKEFAARLRGAFKRCRFVQPPLRSPTFATSQYADNITPFAVHPSNLAG